MRFKFVELGDRGIVVKRRGDGATTVPYSRILTAERLRSRRGLDLHTRGQLQPVRVKCRRSRLYEIESGLRFMGVRIVDCWGAIIAPTFLDFKEQLDLHPVRVRQSYDDA